MATNHRYTEESLSKAIAEVRAGRSVLSASKSYNIPRSTLRGRLNGVWPRAQAYDRLQALSGREESYLAQWAIAQGRLGLAPSHTMLRTFATRILARRGSTAPLGRHKIIKFLRRNPEVRSIRGRKIEYERVNQATPANINIFFDRFDISEVQGIPPADIYNMDEAGIQEGVSGNGIVIGDAKKKRIYVKSPHKRTWTSIIECISVAGKACTPLVIFKGKTVQHQWFDKEYDAIFEGWHFTNTVTGYTSNTIALEWLNKVFLLETTPVTPGAWR